MRIIGTSQASSEAVAPLDGPSFVYQDPGSQRLLYARAVWGLNAGASVPDASPGIPVGDERTSADAGRLTALWESAWRSYWAAIAAVHDEARSEHLLDLESTELADWESAAWPAIIMPELFAEWQRGIPAVEPLGNRYLALSGYASDAFERGLSSVFVLPITGDWTASVEGRLLLISPLVHESNLLLGRAFREFSGESTF